MLYTFWRIAGFRKADVAVLRLTDRRTVNVKCGRDCVADIDIDKVWRFNGSDYEESHRLVFDAVWLL
jgi:hypothetical protein